MSESKRMTRERVIWEGRPLTITWLPPPFRPPREQVIQAYEVCFMAEEKIVLISSDGQLWNLPGGTLELGESPEEALIREVDGGRRS